MKYIVRMEHIAHGGVTEIEADELIAPTFVNSDVHVGVIDLYWLERVVEDPY